ncbi:hypothetical protein Q4E93_05715 [Flavitalea sp. BT771]|uniref:DUF4397 domain-containing protein n=1 Tax=Flavitalea sp. BT771 TaxID=3063329 RepID=UPI0026E278C1|nr:DUF4397 domain-containing protein [Flavitalea sp. BT771]MDO6430071.1 hypothetical protein [Flavitalea sp. BT771]MDV6219790.1 hypothetical protein [Flavitalea sp. BT771]
MRIKDLFLYALLSLSVASCSKQPMPASPSSLTIINAVVGSAPLVTDFSGTGAITWFSGADKIAYNSFSTADYGDNNQLSSYSGIQKLALYQYPDTLQQAKPLFNLTLTLPAGSINSLFLTGTVDAPDTLFVADQLPPHPVSDSVAAIRFVNLSPNSAPVSINLLGKANGSEVATLSYKGITAFTSYPATHDIASYSFEFRDAATETLLATYTADGINNAESDPFNPTKIWRNRNTTLALLGVPGGSGDKALSVLMINNY